MQRPTIEPRDRYNTNLLDNVHPVPWTNPRPEGQYNLVVVGAGTAGLITAAVAGALGAKTALIERHLMGGDCLNVGCVPSKGVIRGARAAAELRWLTEQGLSSTLEGATVDVRAAFERMRRIRSEISSHDSPMRYRDEFGVDVYIGNGRFTGKRTITVSGQDGSERELRFARAAITTGARAAAPPIPGLDRVPYLTNETLFSLTELPDSLAVIGAGPIGCEMAQSFARYGTRVDLFEAAERILIREDAEVSRIVDAALRRDGVHVHCNAGVSRVAEQGDRIVVHAATEAGQPVQVPASKLLVAIGRAPNIDAIGLDAAGVVHDRFGVTVNDYLQTSNTRIYAAGDVASRYQFTHMAEAGAGVLVQNALFFRTKKVTDIVVPWATFTSPEVAHVGMGEADAERSGVAYQVFTHQLAKVDRARLDGEEEGLVKLIVAKGKTRILGATIVAAHAGEMLAEVVLAMQHGLGVDALAGVVHPYPTQSEAIKRAAAGYLRSRLTERSKRILSRWFKWRR